jgi:hypothetical protein
VCVRLERKGNITRHFPRSLLPEAAQNKSKEEDPGEKWLK